MAPILAFRQISKRFYGVTALEDVTFEVSPREIHAVMGANGAGKSTLMKMLVGVNQPDSGEILLDGNPALISSPTRARSLGIDIVFQEIELSPNLNVAESLFLAREPTRTGLLRVAAMHQQTEALMRRLGTDLRPDTPVEALSVAEKQLVQIARALAAGARILIMDEPTSSLTDVEADRLFKILEGLRAEGHTILYISHKLEEVFRLADSITVLRDGRHVATGTASHFTRDSLVSLMTGTAAPDAEGALHRPSAANHSKGQPRLTVEGLTARGRFRDISFSVRPGEVVGFFGIVGAGRTEVARCLFGLDPYDSGRVLVDGQEVRFRSSAEAIAAGLALAPEDRKSQGLLLEESVLRNTTLAILGRISQGLVIFPKSEFAVTGKYAHAMGIVCAGPEQEVRDLSGGNQQKVVIARWLATLPRVLLLDEPTKGIDVAAKREVHRLVREAAQEGIAVMLISSELEEVTALSDRLIVMRDGQIVFETPSEAVTREAIMAHAVA